MTSAFQYPSSGQGNVTEYMISPLPFVTQSTAGNGTATRVDFPFLSSHWTVRNTGAVPLFVGFTQNGAQGTNRFTVPVSAALGPIDMRVKTMYFVGSGGTCTFDLLAGMTSVMTRSFPILTASSPTPTNISSNLYDPYYSYNGIG